jgi:hypothetical protein
MAHEVIDSVSVFAFEDDDDAVEQPAAAAAAAAMALALAGDFEDAARQSDPLATAQCAPPASSSLQQQPSQQQQQQPLQQQQQQQPQQQQVLQPLACPSTRRPSPPRRRRPSAASSKENDRGSSASQRLPGTQQPLMGPAAAACEVQSRLRAHKREATKLQRGLLGEQIKPPEATGFQHSSRGLLGEQIKLHHQQQQQQQQPHSLGDAPSTRSSVASSASQHLAAIYHELESAKRDVQRRADAEVHEARREAQEAVDAAERARCEAAAAQREIALLRKQLQEMQQRGAELGSARSSTENSDADDEADEADEADDESDSPQKGHPPPKTGRRKARTRSSTAGKGAPKPQKLNTSLSSARHNSSGLGAQRSGATGRKGRAKKSVRLAHKITRSPASSRPPSLTAESGASSAAHAAAAAAAPPTAAAVPAPEQGLLAQVLREHRDADAQKQKID